MAKTKTTKRNASRETGRARNARTTVSGPAAATGSAQGDVLAEKAKAVADLAASQPYNPHKADEYSPRARVLPFEGEWVPELPNGDADPGLVISSDAGRGDLDTFIAALGRHRHFERETDPRV
jgi:hypothetical protein